MILTYKPEGAEPRTWAYKPRKLLNVEIEEIERRTGMSLDEWSQNLPPTRFSMLAVRGLLYVLLKRDIPDLAWSAVQFTADEVEFDLEADEKRDALAAIRTMLDDGEIDPDAIDDVRKAIADMEAELAEEGDAPEDNEAPKAPVEPSSESVTGAHSAMHGDGTRAISIA